MEQSSGGEVAAAKRAKAPDAGAGGEDLLSTLPEDVLVLILLRLDTRDAARTSILSRRWRPVWTLQPELWFSSVHQPDGDCLRSILSASEVPLRNLFVAEPDASPQSLAVWLPAAARRVSGHLFVSNFASKRRAADDLAEASKRAAFELPCFEKATSICLNLGLLGLSMPSTGVFSRLKDLDLSGVRFHGPAELGDAVSSPRCPCLHHLTIRNVRGLDNITIDSGSLQLLELMNLHGVQHITVVAPALEYLSLLYCFIHDQTQPIVNISAPQLKSLKWMDVYDPSTVHLGSTEHLHTLGTFFLVYGLDGFTFNNACLMLLPQFKAIESLSHIGLSTGGEELDDLQYLMEDMTVLPSVTSLHLTVTANGHAFGACTFHVLRICSGIKQLMLVLSYQSEEQTLCPSDCISDQTGKQRSCC